MQPSYFHMPFYHVWTDELVFLTLGIQKFVLWISVALTRNMFVDVDSNVPPCQS